MNSSRTKFYEKYAHKMAGIVDEIRTKHEMCTRLAGRDISDSERQIAMAELKGVRIDLSGFEI